MKLVSARLNILEARLKLQERVQERVETLALIQNINRIMTDTMQDEVQQYFAKAEQLIKEKEPHRALLIIQQVK